jgi:hypothetical protein
MTHPLAPLEPTLAHADTRQDRALMEATCAGDVHNFGRLAPGQHGNRSRVSDQHSRVAQARQALLQDRAPAAMARIVLVGHLRIAQHEPRAQGCPKALHHRVAVMRPLGRALHKQDRPGHQITTVSAGNRPPATVPTRGLSMMRFALLTLLALAPQATAQVIPTGFPAADILLSQAIAEHRVFLTCSTLDPEAHAAIQRGWETDVAAATRLLTEGRIAAEAVVAFTSAADPAAFLPTPETPIADVQALCTQHPDWATRHAAGDFIRLAQDLPRALP